MSKIIILALTFILASCQVEKKSGSDDYISDHRSATNSFTLQTNHAGTFKTGDVLSFTLSFPSNVLVTGTPQLALEFNGSTRYADYVSGDQSKTLIFSYTIDASDDDPDGIRFQNINLNGGALKFYLKEVLTDCSTVINAIHFGNIIVDTSGPTVERIHHANALRLYHKEDTLNFIVEFSEPVIVSGNPTLPLTLSSGSRQATLASGSGSTVLIFTYKIQAGDKSSVPSGTALLGVELPHLPAGTTIKDKMGNLLSASIPTITPTTGVLIDGDIPKLLMTEVPEAGTYKVNQPLHFKLHFDRPVILLNAAQHPNLQISIGNRDVLVPYNSLLSSGNVIGFSYTPQPDDVDLDGITLHNSLITSGNIRSVSVNRTFTAVPINNNLLSPDTSEIILEAIRPKIKSITRTADTTTRLTGSPSIDNVWIIGQKLQFVVEFNTIIDVNLVTGRPTLKFQIGTDTQEAQYLTGGNGTTNITFEYTVEVGNDSNCQNIVLTEFLENNAIILDLSGTEPDYTLPVTTLADTQVYAVRPHILSFSHPAGNYRLSQNLDFRVKFNRAMYVTRVTTAGITYPNFNLQIDSGTIAPSFADIGNNSDELTFRHTIVSGNHTVLGKISTTGSLNFSGSARVRDVHGNEATSLIIPAHTFTDMAIDAVLPTASISSQPLAKTYLKDEIINLELTFSEQVTITKDGSNNPRLNTNTANISFTPDFVSSSQTGTVFNFSYQVAQNILTASDLALTTSFTLGSGSIRDDFGNSIATTHGLSLTSGVRVDGRELTINNASTLATGFYRSGEDIDITLTFNRVIGVTGTPQINSQHLGGSTYPFSFESTPTTTTARFRYQVDANDLELDGLASISSVDLNGGSIQFNNLIDADLSFTSLPLSQVKLIPGNYLAWSKGGVQNIFDTSNDFSGPSTTCGANPCFEFTGTEVLTTSISSSIHSVITRILMTDDSLDYDLFNYFKVTIDPGTRLITLSKDPLQTTPTSLRVNGDELTISGDDYQLALTDIDGPFTLEVDFPNPLLSDLVGTGFKGEIYHLLLFSSALSQTSQRTTLYNKIQ